MKQEKIMQLWRECFQDPEEFIAFYFEKKYRDEDALLYEENGEALSAFLMLPYPLVWQGKTFATSYISGACTVASARKRGLMTRLLQEGFREMYERGIALSTLIPAEGWLFDYYARLGYATVFYKSEMRWTPRESVPANCCVETCRTEQQKSIQEVFDYFYRKMQEYPCCITHPREDYGSIVEELCMSGGLLFAARRTDAPYAMCGMALALAEKGEVTVKELLYDDETVKERLLETAAAHWKSVSVRYRTRTLLPDAHPYGMARIIHAEKLLQHFASLHPQLQESVCVADDILPENRGCYRLTGGECRKLDDKLHTSAIDVATLTQKLFCNAEEAPYMSLMMD